jgi:hypothetical protein
MPGVDNGFRLRLDLLEEEVRTLAGIMEELLPIVGSLNAHLTRALEQNDIEAFRKRARETQDSIDNLIAKFDEYWREAE